MTQTVATIGHFDIAGDDMAALTGFYSGLFGWDITLRGPGYAQVATPVCVVRLSRRPKRR